MIRVEKMETDPIVEGLSVEVAAVKHELHTKVLAQVESSQQLMINYHIWTYVL